jgi:pimeloyl-ACP methyl ester carboxylesterase
VAGRRSTSFPASSLRAGADISAASRTLVLLPGLVCDETVWRHAQAALSPRIRTHIADYGHRDSLVEMARDVLAQVPGELSVAGHSMGGRIALEMWRAAPERIQALALLDTGAAPLATGDAGEREVAGRQALVGIARTRGMAAMAREWVQGMVHPARLADSPLITSIVEMFARKSADTFAAQIRALIARPDATSLLGQIRARTLVLCGAEDSWAPATRHREMAAAIPGSRLDIIPDCGHMCTLERPEAVTRALIDWLAS